MSVLILCYSFIKSDSLISHGQSSLPMCVLWGILMEFHVSQLRSPHLWPVSVFGCEKGTLCQEFTMYWKQESMENEVAIISAASKGQGFIYRTRAIQPEEKGPFPSVISVRGTESGSHGLRPCCRGINTQYLQRSVPSGRMRGETANQTLAMD